MPQQRQGKGAPPPLPPLPKDRARLYVEKRGGCPVFASTERAGSGKKQSVMYTYAGHLLLLLPIVAVFFVMLHQIPPSLRRLLGQGP